MRFIPFGALRRSPNTPYDLLPNQIGLLDRDRQSVATPFPVKN